ncbi:MAG TPA: tetratricopeptide repeat protein [Trueperaceae bacterium]|nr:tetratricopeptide repeat protein [Trueperaceae bacterium]
MPRRLLITFLALAAAFTLLQAPAAAQGVPAVTRVVILPFDTDATVSPYQLGLPTALQHALNQVPNLYAPPVGDAALVANKAAAAQLDVGATIGRLFDANAVITGRVATGGGGVKATINVAIGGAVKPVEVQGATPAALATAAAEAVLRIVLPESSAETLKRVGDAAGQTPSVPSLGPTGLAASGLPGARAEDLKAAADLDAGSAWVLVEYARVLALEGDLSAAVAAAKQAATLAPADAEVQAGAGVVFDAANDLEAAGAAFAAALATNPAHAVALAGRAAVEAASATAGGADPSADLQAAINAYPRFVDAYVRLSALQPDSQRALQTLRRAETYAPESILLRSTVMHRLIEGGAAGDALAYLQQALAEPLARSAGLYALARLLPSTYADKALAIVQDGQALYPGSTDLKVAQADLLLQSGHAEEAEAILRPLYTQAPNDLAVGNLLAVAQARRGDLEGAQRTFEAMRGQGADVDRSLAELYLAAGRASGALKLLEPLVAAAPDDAELQALYGTALVRLGRLDDGKQALDTALALEPGQALAKRSLELLDQQRQLTGGADVTFDEEAGVAFQQGLYALDVKDYTAAASAFARSNAAQATGLASFYLGYAKQLGGDTRGAVDAYQVALQSYPDSDIVLNNLGYAQIELGRFDLALDYLRRAVASNPDNAQAHLNLGIVYYAIQRFDESISEFTEAGRLDPSLQATTDGLIADVRKRMGQ